MACWMTIAAVTRSVPLQGIPRQVRPGLHVVDRILPDVLVRLVELHAAGDADEVLRGGECVADWFCVRGAALHDVGDQHDLVVGMGIEVRRIGTKHGFEVPDEVANDFAFVRWIKLHDAYIASRRLACLLLEAEGEPDGAELDRRAIAALHNPGLRQRLRDLQALPFKRIRRDHVDLSEASDAGGNRSEVVHLTAKPDVSDDLAPKLREGLVEYLGVADARIGVFVEQDGGTRVEVIVGVNGDVNALHDLVRHDAERPRIAWLRDLDRRRAGIDERDLRLRDRWHDSERRVGALFADDHVRLVLIDQAPGGLCRWQGAAGRIFILDGEPVAIDASLVELFEGKLDTLLVLCAEIGARARNRQQPSDLDRFVLSEASRRGGHQADGSTESDKKTRQLTHGVLHEFFDLQRRSNECASHSMGVDCSITGTLKTRTNISMPMRSLHPDDAQLQISCALTRRAPSRHLNRRRVACRATLPPTRKVFYWDEHVERSTCPAAASPVERPRTVAVKRPFPDRYPAAIEPDTPAAAPPAAKRFG